jgi:hypothetical protein
MSTLSPTSFRWTKNRLICRNFIFYMGRAGLEPATLGLLVLTLGLLVDAHALATSRERSQTRAVEPNPIGPLRMASQPPVDLALTAT